MRITTMARPPQSPATIEPKPLPAHRATRLVHAMPGRTCGELADTANADASALMDALLDAKRLGYVTVGNPRSCTRSGRRAVTWLPNPTAPAGGLLDVRG